MTTTSNSRLPPPRPRVASLNEPKGPSGLEAPNGAAAARADPLNEATNPPASATCGCCCGSRQEGAEAVMKLREMASGGDPPWGVGRVTAGSRTVTQIDTALRFADTMGTWKARWGIGRMDYKVAPGLYAVGQPTAKSPVLVSANYKMSFDRLRRELTTMDAWLLVLDTNGVNVWCAAGKGTFGTDELVRQIGAAGLSNVVSHRTLIVPQLGAPGVTAHEVRARTGFRVVYGPVRAKDIPAYLTAGMRATPAMRRVEFPLADRLAVTPVELVMSAKPVLLIMACLVLLGGLGADGYSWSRAAVDGINSAAIFLVAFICGTVLTPILLPWLPGRALAIKGVLLGLALTLGVGGLYGNDLGRLGSWPNLAAWSLLIPAITSFTAMNFTGSTTYTSLSGVRREMRVAAPLQALAAGVGTVLWLVGRFV